MANNALVVKKETVDIVLEKIKAFQNTGELVFPKNYIPENALKSAWLIVQETVNRDKKPVLDACSRESISNALLSMVIQGLNPNKNQCYFIAYGQKLNLQRSYFGSMVVAKTINEDIEDIFGDVVYEADEFEYSKVRGKNVITKHIQKLQNVNKSKIVAAYATILYFSGKEESVIMTLDQIKQAWKQSPMNPITEDGKIKSGSTHDKFMADMCIKTVINKACKPIINSSDDRNLVARFAKATDDEFTESRVENTIAQNANKEVIDIVPTEVEGKPDQNPPENEQPMQDNPPKENPQPEQNNPEGPEF